MSLRPAALCSVAVVRFSSGSPGSPGSALGLEGDPVCLPGPALSWALWERGLLR